MLKELFDAIVAKAVEAASPRVVPGTPEPKHVYYLQTPNGGISQKVAEPEPRRHAAWNVKTIVDFAKDTEDAAVWYSSESIVCFLDDSTRRDVVDLKLDHSNPFNLLCELDKSRRSYKQAEFVKLLRIDLAGCLNRCPTLVDILRKVQFKVGSQVAVEVGHGKTSVGKQLESEVRGTGAIPEFVELDIPVFESVVQFSAVVVCAIEPDAGTESFQIIPLQGQVEKARQDAEARVGAMLKEALGNDVPIYCGVP